jgi:hypothetical protein
MKQLRFSGPVLLAISALLIAGGSQSVEARESNSPDRSSAIFATSASDGGRLIIRRSPVLGDNVQISLTIDGKVAGTLVRGRTYDRYIVPGRHILVASPNRSRGDWQGILTLRRGETYSYTASVNANGLMLTPGNPR